MYNQVAVAQKLFLEIGRRIDMLYIGDKAYAPVVKVPSDNNGKYIVRVIDYDGTVLKEARLNTGDKFTLPNPPTNHPRLVFDCWSSSAPIVNNKVTVTDNDILIGPIYDTVSGLTEFDIYVPEAAVGVAGRFNVNGTKDWGDGTTSTSGSHTYSQAGYYTIKVNCTSIGGGQYNGVFVQYDYNDPTFKCSKLFISSNVTNLSAYPFTKMYLEELTLPSSLTTFNSNFNVSSKTRTLIIPPGTTSLPDNFSTSSREDYVVLPYGLTSLGSNCLKDKSTLRLCPIPSTCTTFGTSFMTNHGLETVRFPEGTLYAGRTQGAAMKELILPDSVTEFGGFWENYSLRRISFGKDFNNLPDGNIQYMTILESDFSRCEQIPTLGGTNNALGFVIKVPAALYSQWITETNWVSYAGRIVAV